MNKQEPISSSGLLLVVLATSFWATSSLFINLVIKGSSLSPLGLAFWRDLGTFTCLAGGMALFRPELLRVRRQDLPWLAAMGAISIGFFHVMWNMAVLFAGAAVATVLQSNAPICVTLLAWLIWREPLTRRKIGAIGLAFVGTVLISRLHGLSQSHLTLTGLLSGLAAAISYSGLSLFGKKLTGDYSPWTVLTYAFGFGTLVLLPLQLYVPLPWPVAPGVLAAYAALVLLPSISGFGLYTTALRRLPASVASIVATTEVPFAAIMAYVALGERLDGWQILGAILVVGGVILLSWSQGSQRVAHLLRRAQRTIICLKLSFLSVLL